jgi:hypothetical protein
VLRFELHRGLLAVARAGVLRQLELDFVLVVLLLDDLVDLDHAGGGCRGAGEVQVLDFPAGAVGLLDELGERLLVA